MCRGVNLGTCCAAGCETVIRCQDTGGYCDAHDPYDFAWGDEDAEPQEKPPRPPDDPEKRRVYDLGRVRRGISAKRTLLIQTKHDLDVLTQREQQLTASREKVPDA